MISEKFLSESQAVVEAQRKWLEHLYNKSSNHSSSKEYLQAVVQNRSDPDEFLFSSPPRLLTKSVSFCCVVDERLFEPEEHLYATEDDDIDVIVIGDSSSSDSEDDDEEEDTNDHRWLPAAARSRWRDLEVAALAPRSVRSPMERLMAAAAAAGNGDGSSSRWHPAALAHLMRPLNAV